MTTLKSKHLLSAIIAMMISAPLFAQGAPPATPIDGGLSILLIAGGAYAIKRIKENRN